MTIINGTFGGEKPAEVRIAMATYLTETGRPHLQFFTSAPVDQTTGSWSVELDGGAYLADWKIGAGRSGVAFVAPFDGTYSIDELVDAADGSTVRALVTEVEDLQQSLADLEGRIEALEAAE